MMAPAKTGRDSNSNTAVITTAQPNNASLCNLIPGLLIFNIVVMTPNKTKHLRCYGCYQNGLYLQRIFCF